MRFAHQHQAGLDLGFGHDLRLVEIALGPGGDHVGHIDGIARLAQQMIGAGERDEALRMLGGGEDVRGVVDADQIVGRRMEHQQRLAQSWRGIRCSFFSATSSRNSRLMRNGRPASCTSTSPCCADLVDLILEQADHVAGIVRRGDGDDAARLGDAMRRPPAPRSRRGYGRSGSPARRTSCAGDRRRRPDRRRSRKNAYWRIRLRCRPAR